MTGGNVNIVLMLNFPLRTWRFCAQKIISDAAYRCAESDVDSVRNHILPGTKKPGNNYFPALWRLTESNR